MKVQFPTETLDFDQLTNKLAALEKVHHLSSLEIFHQFVNGNLDDPAAEEWLGLILLYLGTDEIRHYACPSSHDYS